MDCNRDEAVRAKEISEKKFAEKDYFGAKKFALKALNLYPGLDSISQMLTTLDIHISAENRTAGESDWYGILGVNSSADEDTMKKQYRKLALSLHPDKNKSLGADSAFKLVSEAWSLLSDRAKRLAYNQRRHLSNGFQQKISTQSGPNGLHNLHNPSLMAQKKFGTFWTVCNRCKMQYEYQRIYLNHTLLCPTCNEAFLALETHPPLNFTKSYNSSSRHQSIKNMFNSSNLANLQPANARVKREREEAHNLGSHASTKMAAGFSSMYSSGNAALKGERPSKKRRGADDDRTNVLNESNIPGRKSNFVTERASNVSGNKKLYKTRELSILETRNMLMERALTEIRKKQTEWSLDREKKKTKEREEEMQKSMGIGELHATEGFPNNKKALVGTKEEEENLVEASMNVPDSDFHDFDKDRTESSFGDNQVWATYDDEDGMPRYYAIIHKVISLNPFKMKISWLNSKTNSEFGQLDWVGSGFLKTCGDFRIGRHEINETLNAFSHEVKFTKGQRGSIRILPRKGDVWALYRNWQPSWNEETPDEVIHKYDMVEVLDNYNETGVSVSLLIKVVGFRTVFRQCLDTKEVWRIPKEEMFRFSHQVPNYLLTGEEGKNAPKGCRELDPAATPLDLLQVISEVDAKVVTEAKEEGGAENGDKITDEVVIRNFENCDKIKDEGIVGNDEKIEKIKHGIMGHGDKKFMEVKCGNC